MQAREGIEDRLPQGRSQRPMPTAEQQGEWMNRRDDFPMQKQGTERAGVAKLEGLLKPHCGVRAPWHHHTVQPLASALAQGLPEKMSHGALCM